MHGQVFFADEGLRASVHPIFSSATVVNVAFLDFGSYATAAPSAAKKTHEGFGRPFYRRVSRCPAPTTIHDDMHGVKQVFGNDRFMCAFVHLAAVTEMAVINRVGKNLRDMPPDEQFAIFGADTVFT
ncbi:MAG TPA: hypothetical protein VK815_08915 [Candidatus Acidoferrales bacterium]|nr:hypothetical protein [Candidatus Acidoferrales bacterium]